MDYINDTLVQGVIVNKFVSSKVGIVTISTGSATKVPNYPKIICFGAVKDKLERDFKKGDMVTVRANIQSSIKKDDIKNQSLLSVFAESIEPAKSVLEESFGVTADAARKEFVDSVKLAGTVTKIRKVTDNLVNVTVFTKKNGRISFVTVSYYTKSADALLDEIKEKDDVYIIGNIQTSKKDIKGETKYFQNYIATEIIKQ